MLNIKKILIFLSVFLYSCSQIGEYPKEIIENNLQKEYDKAKWLFYCLNYPTKGIYCNSASGWYKDSLKHIISCNIQISELQLLKDTAIITLFLYNNDTCEACRPKDTYFINKFIFPLKDTNVYTIMYGWGYDEEILRSQRNFELYSDTADAFGIYPLRIQLEKFKNFLRNTDVEINPWLKKEANKRGILKK
jgi:hypothetical protein